MWQASAWGSECPFSVGRTMPTPASLSVRDTYPSGIVFFFTMLKAGAGRAGDNGESAHSPLQEPKRTGEERRRVANSSSSAAGTEILLAAPLRRLGAARSAPALPERDLSPQRAETPGSCKRRGQHLSEIRARACPALTPAGPAPPGPGHRQYPPGPGAPPAAEGPMPAAPGRPRLPPQSRHRGGEPRPGTARRRLSRGEGKRKKKK